MSASDISAMFAGLGVFVLSQAFDLTGKKLWLFGMGAILIISALRLRG